MHQCERKWNQGRAASNRDVGLGGGSSMAATAARHFHACQVPHPAASPMHRLLHAFLTLFLAGTGSTAFGLCPSPPGQVSLPNATESGYLDIDDKGSRLFFVYYEAQDGAQVGHSRHKLAVPITLWLQARLLRFCSISSCRQPPQLAPALHSQPAAAAAAAQVGASPHAGRARLRLAVWRILRARP